MLVFRAMNGNDPVTRRLPVDETTVAAALELTRDFAVAAHVTDDTSARLAIIVEELVLNLIDHGGARGEIAIALSADTDAISLILIDSGAPYDPRHAAIPATIPDRGGGVGLALVGAWARIVDYTRTEGRNRLILTLPR